MNHDAQIYHQSVLLTQALEQLGIRPGGSYIDCTLGDGGHTLAMLDASAPDGRLLGLDADPEAVAACRSRLAPYGGRAVVAQTNFADLEPVAIANGFAPVQGIFFDLGLSSRQLDAEERGFSFRRPDPLDMRFDPSEGTPAAELVNHMDEQALANLIYRLGEEHRSRRIARGIVANRPIDTALQLAEVVRRAAGYRRSRTHPATRTFQALRMGVNREMENLEVALGASLALLEQNGRLVTIAYHSLEDRLIKTFIAAAARLRPIVKRVIKPDQEEIRRNPRSRSARLRVAELV